jgi:hypothetical protein
LIKFIPSVENENKPQMTWHLEILTHYEIKITFATRVYIRPDQG